MKRFARLLVVTAVFGMLGFAMSLVSQKNATGAGGAPVNITSPLPLPVTGSVNANITNTSALPVSFNGTTQPVSFSNQSTAPLYTRDVDKPAHNPFTAQAGCSAVPIVNSCANAAISVPSGNELVIEAISIIALEATPQQDQLYATIEVTTNGTTHFDALLLPLAGAFNGYSTYPVTQSVHLYADGGTSILLGGYQTGTGGGGATFTFSLSGYLVKCGSGSGCPVP